MHTVLQAFSQLTGQLLLLLHLLSPFALDPTVCSIIGSFFFELLGLRKELGYTRNGAFLAIFGRAIARGDESKWWPRLEKSQQRRGKFVCHQELRLVAVDVR